MKTLVLFLLINVLVCTISAERVEVPQMYLGLFNFYIPYVDNSVEHDGFVEVGRNQSEYKWRDNYWGFIVIYDPGIVYRFSGAAPGFVSTNSINLDYVVASDTSEFIGYSGPGLGIDFDIDGNGCGIGGNVHYANKLLKGFLNMDFGVQFMKFSDFHGTRKDDQFHIFASFFNILGTVGIQTDYSRLEPVFAIGLRL